MRISNEEMYAPTDIPFGKVPPYRAKVCLLYTSSYMLVFPGCAIMVTALSFNLFGDGLRDALDPKLKD